MLLPLRHLGSPCYSGVAIGGVNECQDAGYQGAGMARRRTEPGGAYQSCPSSTVTYSLRVPRCPGLVPF